MERGVVVFDGFPEEFYTATVDCSSFVIHWCFYILFFNGFCFRKKLPLINCV